ncbi:MAG TPA: PAC2 family protein [Ktedonobacteraceae bacterium]|nr:PAC2 family protein [Ktedonobacteraceae bacterium]
MPLIKYYGQPRLRSPVVIAAFAGWNDAADSATTAVKLLIEQWKPIKLAEIDAEEFFDFTETRPTIRLVEGQRSIIWPTNQFLYYNAPGLDHDVILYIGVEPQLKWKKFTESFLEVCKQFSVSEVLLLGALLADIPHSVAVPMTGFSSYVDLAERLGEMDVRGSRYEGPTGMVGVLYDACLHANIPTASLWAAVPHYLAATPNIKVTAALLTYVNTFLSLGLDLNDIQADAVRFEEQITALVARDPEASAYVRKLEEQVAGMADEDEDEENQNEGNIGDSSLNLDRITGTGPLPSADDLIRGVEELLRKERENGDQQSNDDKDEA